MPAWCRRLRRRAILVLACLLMAVAVGPGASERDSLRPVAALVLRAASATASAATAGASVARRARVAARRGVEAERRTPLAPRAGTLAAPDGRYLYLRHGKLLC